MFSNENDFFDIMAQWTNTEGRYTLQSWLMAKNLFGVASDDPSLSLELLIGMFSSVMHPLSTFKQDQL